MLTGLSLPVAFLWGGGDRKGGKKGEREGGEEGKMGGSVDSSRLSSGEAWEGEKGRQEPDGHPCMCVGAGGVRAPESHNKSLSPIPDPFPSLHCC